MKTRFADGEREPTRLKDGNRAAYRGVAQVATHRNTLGIADPGWQAIVGVARLEIHGDLLEIARDDARLVLDRDPDLRSERGAALRLLLYLYGRDDAVRLLRAG